MKELEHLKYLSQVRSNTGVKFLTPAAYPGSHCPMHTALALSANIKGMSTLVVGTSECSTYSRNIVSKATGRGFNWMYVLDANEVVFGCRKGLIDAIKQMDNEGEKAIMVILTCLPEVIGEDMEGIIHEIQPNVNAKLSFVQMAHFKGNSYPSGYWKTLLAFKDLMQLNNTDINTINILGRSPDEDHILMPNLLKVLENKGFKLRMLAPKSNIEDFVNAPNARLNLILLPYMNPLAEAMEKTYNIPFISLHDIYSVLEIDKVYKEIADILEISFKDEFKEERETALLLQNNAKDIFGGLSYVSTRLNALSPIPLAYYLEEFNMKPIVLHIEEFYPNDRQWAKKLTEKGCDPKVCHMVNDEADSPLLEKFSPSISFGEVVKGTSKIPYVGHMYELSGKIGYERTADLLNRMIQSFEKRRAN